MLLVSNFRDYCFCFIFMSIFAVCVKGLCEWSRAPNRGGNEPECCSSLRVPRDEVERPVLHPKPQQPKCDCCR